MLYTNEQLAAMTAEQLKAAILELQTAGAVIVTDMTQAVVEPVVAPETPVQTDIEGMKAVIVQFEESGAEVFPDALASMKQKLADAEDEVKAAAKEVKDEVRNLEEEKITFAENFRAKHGVSWQVALVCGAFIIWQVGAAVVRALGVL
ncbi:gas vesicle protein [Sporomusaceae bacterium BoRhaA]|uniref:hypothetical protein n=1 Tax=Pelorhabdus rhamnosifermentans TaxID=2772457 RepID=UPI001C05F67A|nr:hypothetical protein [Pelorhabdus rhamnosifermentans]MBU2702287.1 gas vesicle protein [Pelorhabdus rhamnosifermentans]